ncbi:CLUMA_CG004245, isoform A, partial [Clunio marinus]
MSDNREEIQDQIKIQGEVVRKLKAAKESKGKIDEEVAKLLALKAKLTENEPSAPQKFSLKTPKGTRDYNPQQMALRQSVLDKIVKVFKKHGAETIDTPVFELKDFVIKLNHRKLLDGMFEACGVPNDKFRTICSAVDKLDKSPWEEVKKEMIDEKGLDEATADRIGEYVRLNGGVELVEKLLKDEKLKKVPSAVEGLEGMKLLLQYCAIFDVANHVAFDLSLARGLDYYTGVIYEAVLKGDTKEGTKKKKEEETVGSVAGGGRYDNLVGMFDGKGKQVPCVGVSIGVERVFAILEAKNAVEKTKLRTTEVQVYVASAHKGLHEKRLEILGKLWSGDIKAEHSYKQNPKLLAQLQHCEEYQIPFALVLGDSELERGVVKLRDVVTRQEEEVPVDNLVEAIKWRLSSRRST